MIIALLVQVQIVGAKFRNKSSKDTQTIKHLLVSLCRFKTKINAFKCIQKFNTPKDFL